MIYLYYGTDLHRARAKWRATIDATLAKNTTASYFLVTGENFALATFEELIIGQSLFAQKYIVALDGLTEQAEGGEYFLKMLKEIAASPNIFIVLEGKLDKATVKKFETKAEKIQNFDLTEKVGSKNTFNIFTLTDLLGARDKKGLWVGIQKATRAGIAAEEVFWKLVWQTKNLLLIKSLAGKVPGGMNPYVASKAGSLAKNWSLEELKNVSSRLVIIYHQARRGLIEMDVALERLILEI